MQPHGFRSFRIADLRKEDQIAVGWLAAVAHFIKETEEAGR
jgi:hypothetical protein